MSTSVMTVHVRMEQRAPTLTEVISAHVRQASRENSANKVCFVLIAAHSFVCQSQLFPIPYIASIPCVQSEDYN